MAQEDFPKRRSDRAPLDPLPCSRCGGGEEPNERGRDAVRPPRPVDDGDGRGGTRKQPPQTDTHAATYSRTYIMRRRRRRRRAGSATPGVAPSPVVRSLAPPWADIAGGCSLARLIARHIARLSIWEANEATKSTSINCTFERSLPRDHIVGHKGWLKASTFQGCTKRWTPGSVKLKRKNCVLLPAAGRRTQFFTSHSRNLGTTF